MISKKKLIAISTVCILGLIILSCNKQEDSIKYIDIKKTDRVIDTQTLTEQGEFVKLEATPQSIIGEIIDIKRYKDKLYILEETGSLSRILVFSLSGKFILELGSYGRGPEELENPRSFCFKDSSIFIWDIAVHHLTLDGQYVEKMFEYFVGGSQFDIRNNKFIIFHGPSVEAYVSILDLNGKLKKKFKADNIPYELGSSQNDAIISCDDGFTFYSQMLDVIYQLNKDILVPKYTIRYSNMKNLADVLPKQSLNPYELLQIINSPNLCNNSRYFETEDLIFMNCYYNGNKINTIVYKDDWETISFASLHSKDLGIDVTPDFMIDDCFCKVLNTYDFTVKKNVDKVVGTDLYPLLKDAKIDDNPILYIYKIIKP